MREYSTYTKDEAFNLLNSKPVARDQIEKIVHMNYDTYLFEEIYMLIYFEYDPRSFQKIKTTKKFSDFKKLVSSTL